MSGVIVGEDEDNVRPFLGRGAVAGELADGGQSEERQDGSRSKIYQLFASTGSEFPLSPSIST
jgi:hypothetical protein